MGILNLTWAVRGVFQKLLLLKYHYAHTNRHKLELSVVASIFRS